MNVAELCMARYKAESIDYSKGMGGAAASLGTSVHGALEMYVKAVYLNKSHEASIKLLLDFFKMSYMTTFGTADLDTEDYSDGVDMLKAWFKRTDFTGRTVVSCEVKTHFDINTSIGPIPFNYIWDRFDQVGETEYEVIDYKTNRWGLNPGDLRKKIQARAYGLAAQIQVPDATRIWVKFDMLRHDGPVGTVFTREDNAATWGFLKRKAQQIIDTPEDRVRETLNPECLFCVRKQACGALRKNINSGGIFSLSNPQQMVDQRTMLDDQLKAVQSAIRELDDIILREAKEADMFEFESEFNNLTIGVSSRRSVEPDFVEKVIGQDLFNKYGGRSFTIASVEKLLKGSEIDEPTKKKLRGLIFQKAGEPRVSVSHKSAIGED